MADQKTPKPKRDVLPANIDAERFVLGSILLNQKHYPTASAILSPSDFSLDKHHRAFERMGDLFQRGETIDRVTLMAELQNRGELEAFGGLAYLIELDTGLPATTSVSSYARIVKDKSILRRTVLACRETAMAAMDQQDSPVEVLYNGTRRLIQLDLEADDKKGAMNPLKIMTSHPEGMSGFLTHAIKPGIPTGFEQIDEAIHGLMPACQYVVGGLTGHGKTALTVAILCNIARRGIPVGLSALEMSKEMILSRLICSEAMVPLRAYLRNELDRDQRGKVSRILAELAEIPLYIDDTPGLTPMDIQSRVSRMVVEHGIKVWALDYIGLIDWRTPKAGITFRTEYDGLTYTSQICNLVARRFDLATIVVSQLSRAAAKKQDPRPQLSDLKSTGQIENDATAVIFPFIEDKIKPGRPELKERAEIIIRKSRYGETGTKIFRFVGKYVRFYDEGPQGGGEDSDVQ